MQIAGALINSRTATQLREAIDRNIEARDRNTEALRYHGKMIARAGEDLREVSFEIRSLIKE